VASWPAVMGWYEPVCLYGLVIGGSYCRDGMGRLIGDA